MRIKTHWSLSEAVAVPKVPGSKAVEAPAEEGPEKLAGQAGRAISKSWLGWD